MKDKIKGLLKECTEKETRECLENIKQNIIKKKRTAAC